ncbi:murein biosynthesis integral membrane protein MurJ [Alphaproteobacteria bacterium]|nr:murein biosynthesis integral membrane protein MurJ [Alphaproteobacteria bacterium]
MTKVELSINPVMRGFRQVGFFTGISRILGLIRDILFALVLGAGAASDAFLVALKLPNLFRRITAEGALTNVFLPAYETVAANKNEKSALQLVTEVQVLLVLSLSFLVIVFELLMPYIIPLLAPGFKATADRLETAILLARITMPYLVMISLVALWSALLNTHRIFWPGAAAPILLNLALIVGAGGVFFSAGQLTDKTLLSLTLPLAVSVVIAGFLQLLFLKIILVKHQLMPSWRWRGISDASKKMWRSFVPAAFSAGSVQINIFVDMILASTLPIGAISWLYYGDRITQLPLGIIGIALGTALLPHLSRLHAKGERQEMAKSLSNSLYLGGFFALPATAALLVLSPIIISGIFGYGAFDSTDVGATASALIAYGIGLPAFVAQKLFQSVFYASNRPAIILRISLATVAVNIILSVILMQYFGHIGLALGTSIAIWLGVFCQAILLFKDQYLSAKSFPKLLPIILSCILMAVILKLLNIWLTTIFQTDIYIVIILVIAGLCVYFGMARIAGFWPSGLLKIV